MPSQPPPPGGERQLLVNTVSMTAQRVLAQMIAPTVEGEAVNVAAPSLSLLGVRDYPDALSSRSIPIGDGNSTTVELPVEALMANVSASGGKGGGNGGGGGGGPTTVDSMFVRFEGNPRLGASAAAASSSLLSVTLAAGGETLEVKNLSTPVRLTFMRAPPPPAAAPCAPSAGREACDAEFEAALAAAAAEVERCADLTGPRIGVAAARWAEECAASVASLNVKARAQRDACAAIEPVCKGRGVCVDGACACDAGWQGGECELRAACSFWSEAEGAFSSAGCVSDDAAAAALGPGAAVCVCNHPTEFAAIEEAVTNFSAFLDSFNELEVRLPPQLTFAEFIESLERISPVEWAIVAVGLVLMGVGLRVAAAFDDRNAYVTFYPKWHERLVSGVGRVTRMAGALLLFFLSTHHMLGVFFFLPIKPLSRAQRAMVVYAIVLGELCVTFLFFGTNQPSALARLWATVIDCGAVIFVGFVCRLFFIAAVRRTSPDATEDTHASWRLVARQTVVVAKPPKGKGRSSRAAPPQPFAGDWSRQLLLRNENAPNYCSELAVQPGRFRRFGRLTCKLVLTRRGESKPQVLVWQQSTSVISAKVQPSATGLRLGSAVGFESFAGVSFDGIVRCAPGDDHTPPPALLCGGFTAEGEPLFAIGQRELNAWGGLNGCEVSERGTVHKVELYFADPLAQPPKGFTKTAGGDIVAKASAKARARSLLSSTMGKLSMSNLTTSLKREDSILASPRSDGHYGGDSLRHLSLAPEPAKNSPRRGSVQIGAGQGAFRPSFSTGKSWNNRRNKIKERASALGNRAGSFIKLVSPIPSPPATPSPPTSPPEPWKPMGNYGKPRPAPVVLPEPSDGAAVAEPSTRDVGRVARRSRQSHG